MRKLTISLILVLHSFFCLAQLSAGGPDLFGYTYRTSAHMNGPNYQWFDIRNIGTSVQGLSDDNYVGPFAISGFPYYSSTPNFLYIGSNGYIAFSPVNIASSGGQFPSIPLSSTPNNFIAPLLTDLNCGGTSNQAQVYYYNQGDTICVSFLGVPFWQNNANQYSGDNAFQVILNKADSSITFNYKKQVGSPDPAYVNNALTIGIENRSGTDGLEYYRGMTFPSANFSIKFYYPSVVQSIYDASLNWIENDQNGGVFIKNNTPFNPRVNIKNTGNQAIQDSIKIVCTVKDSNGIVIQIDSISIDSLGLNADSSKIIPLNFTPTYNGRFSLRANIKGLSIDQVSTNNAKEILLISRDTTLPRNRYRLVYTNDSTSIGGVSWIGGNGGVGIYVEPPFHPFKIETAGFFIPSIGGANGFHSVIYDDNTRRRRPGTLLDSTFINNFHILPMSYYVDTVRNTIIKNQGGVYLLCLFDGTGITLGRSFVGNMPPSRRTYEVIGGNWAEYRESATQEFLMYIEVSNPLITSFAEQNSPKNEIKVYPIPSNDQVIIEDKTMDISIEDIFLFNEGGKLQSVDIKRISNGVQLNKGNLSNGVYYLQVGKKVSKIVFID